MNITLEGDLMAQMDANNKNNKQEDVSLSKRKEELQDTTAKDRRLDFWDQPISSNR
jgi:hypothetical protein